jgi:hypothetical protein
MSILQFLDSRHWGIWLSMAARERWLSSPKGKKVRILSMLVLAFLAIASLTATSQVANAIVYCKYIGYPKGCAVRPGAHLVARPAGVGTVGVGTTSVRNRNGGVNRAGRRR